MRSITVKCFASFESFEGATFMPLSEITEDAHEKFDAYPLIIVRELSTYGELVIHGYVKAGFSNTNAVTVAKKEVAKFCAEFPQFKKYTWGIWFPKDPTF